MGKNCKFGDKCQFKHVKSTENFNKYAKSEEVLNDKIDNLEEINNKYKKEVEQRKSFINEL